MLCIAVSGLLDARAAYAEDDARRAFDVTSSAGHIWFILPPAPEDEEPRWSLCHASSLPTTLTYRIVRELSRPPECMVAHENVLWIIRRTGGAGDVGRRSIHRLEIHEHATIKDFWYVRPNGHEPLVAWMTGEGTIVDIDATSDGPILLVEPRFEASPSERSSDNRMATASTTAPGAPLSGRNLPLTTPTLFALDPVMQRVNAIETDVPLDDLAPLRFVDVGVAYRRLAVLHRDTAAPSTTTATLVGGDEDGDTLFARADVDIDDIINLLHVDERLVALTRSDLGRRLVSLRDDGIRRHASVSDPSAPAAMVRLGSDVGLLRHVDRVPSIAIFEHDPNLDVAYVELTEHERSPQSFLATVYLFCTLASLLMLIVVLKPSGRLSIDHGEQPVATPSSRLVGLLIDLLPGAVVALLLFDIGVSELFRMPYVVTNTDDAMPYLVMVVTMSATTFVQERMTGRTLGHRAIGARLFGESGQPIPVGRHLIRSAVKCLTVIVPPITIFALVTPQMLGLHDVLSRSVVVSERPETSDTGEHSSQ